MAEGLDSIWRIHLLGLVLIKVPSVCTYAPELDPLSGPCKPVGQVSDVCLMLWSPSCLRIMRSSLRSMFLQEGECQPKLILFEGVGRQLDPGEHLNQGRPHLSAHLLPKGTWLLTTPGGT